MVGLLKDFKNTGVHRLHTVPAGFRVYAVGDIHGRADLLRRLHVAIEVDAGERYDNKENIIVYLGDYLDRGPYVKETIDEVIRGAPDGFHVVHLAGNHEQLFLNFLEDPCFLDIWLSLGGQSTLLSYQVKAPGLGFSIEHAKTARQDLLEIIPAYHLEFLRELKPFFQLGDYLFVHAGIRPGIPVGKQSLEDLLWIREEFLTSDADHELKVIHGHTISRGVQKYFNRIGVDTGAYASGILTCVVLEDSRVRFLSTGYTC